MGYFICATVAAVFGFAAAALCRIASEADTPPSPRCKNCYHCKPIPGEVKDIFGAEKRMCVVGRGDDFDFREINGLGISVVQPEYYCNEFTSRDCEGGRYE